MSSARHLFISNITQDFAPVRADMSSIWLANMVYKSMLDVRTQYAGGRNLDSSTFPVWFNSDTSTRDADLPSLFDNPTHNDTKDPTPRIYCSVRWAFPPSVDAHTVATTQTVSSYHHFARLMYIRASSESTEYTTDKRPAIHSAPERLVDVMGAYLGPSGGMVVAAII